MSKYKPADRKQNGLTHKLYLIDVLVPKDKYTRAYTVMGSTGNVYEVTVTKTPSCTCPDYVSRKKRCKHIFFILLRIMHVTDGDKGSYTQNELLEMFNKIPPVTNYLCVDNDTRNKYIELKSKQSGVDQKALDDVCPICLEDLSNGEELDFCKYSCGKNIHKNCFEMVNQKRDIKEILCPFCRHNWEQASTGYLNLGNKET
jgi:hypothetical protein